MHFDMTKSILVQAMADLGSAGTPRRRTFEVAVQRSRALVYTTAVALGCLGNLLGVIEVGWIWIGVLLFVANASATLFFVLARRGVARLAGLPCRWWWMATDVLIISWAVYLSGGPASAWFVFYLTNVAAAAYVAGTRAMLVIMACNTLAYLAVGALTVPLTPVVALQLVGRKLILYGAAIYALLGIPRLERRRREVKELQRQERTRAAELAEVAAQLESANQALQQLSLHDPLTGLPNRRFLQEHARREVAQVRRILELTRRRRVDDPNSSLGFFMVDLDHFKAVNDVFGHEVGDRLLVETGRTLRRALRDADAVIRWGGEEFLAVAHRVNRAFMWVIGERIRAQVAAQRLKTRAGQEIAITCSVGYCCFPLGRAELFAWDEVVALADAALLLAKRAGRNRVVGFELGLRELGLGDRERVLRNPPWAVRAGFLTLTGEVSDDLLATAASSHSGVGPAVVGQAVLEAEAAFASPPTSSAQ